MKVEEFRELVNKYLNATAGRMGMCVSAAKMANPNALAALRYLLAAKSPILGNAHFSEHTPFAEIVFSIEGIETCADPHTWIASQLKYAVRDLFNLAVSESGLQRECDAEREKSEPTTAPTDDDGA